MRKLLKKQQLKLVVAKKRTPGKRRNATEILRHIAALNIASCILLASLAGIGSLLWEPAQLGRGVSIGLLVVAFSNIFSWLFESYVISNYPKYAPLLSIGSYIIKILLVFAVLVLVRVGKCASLSGVLGGFIAGLLLSLVISSLVIMRSPGPDFENETPRENSVE